MAHRERNLKRRSAAVGLICLLLTLFGCRSTPPGPPESPPTWLSEVTLPSMHDDLDRASLQLALQRSLGYLRRLPADRALPFGDRWISVASLRATLETFGQLLAQAATPERLAAEIAKQFEIVQTTGTDGRGRVLFTGYHEIQLDGSLQPTAEYTYPVYRRPADLVDIDLGLFRQRYAGERLVARIDRGKILPYFTRREIDTDGKLRGRGLELAWLRDPVEGFFLHIEGSGQIRLPDGQTMYVNYAASNGHAYRSIGRMLIEEGHFSPGAVSLQGLRHYFRTHPHERARVLNANPRYIFFRQVKEGPKGNLDFVLVPGRSIATDARLFPAAGLAFIQTQQPVLNDQGAIVSWQSLSRFVFNHDTGSAITGPGRVDLFWGSDTAAEMAAGHMQHPGALFFLLLRPPPASTQMSSATTPRSP